MGAGQARGRLTHQAGSRTPRRWLIGRLAQTFLTTPDRGRVVAAKLAAYALTGMAVAVLTLAVTVAVALPWMNAKGLSVSVLDGGLGRVLGGTLLAAGLCGLVGVGVGALIRNQVAALVGVLVRPEFRISAAGNVGLESVGPTGPVGRTRTATPPSRPGT